MSLDLNCCAEDFVFASQHPEDKKRLEIKRYYCCPVYLPVNICSGLMMVCLRLGGQMNGNDWNVCSEGPQVETVDGDHVRGSEQVGVDGVVAHTGWRPLQQY